MSQLVLDDQLDVYFLLPALRKWITVERLQTLRRGEQILDDRVPAILRALNQPTFISIDADVCDRSLCHPDYAILYFALTKEQQELIRALFRRPEFKTKAARMGKVARISTVAIEYWEWRVQDVQHIDWQPSGRTKR